MCNTWLLCLHAALDHFYLRKWFVYVSFLIWNLSLPVGREVISNQTKPTMLQLQENLSLLQLIGCIFYIYKCIYIFFAEQFSLTHNTTNYSDPHPSLHLHPPKPRLFVTVVIGRLNTVQYSPDPHPIGSLQTLRRYKRKQNSWPCPTHVSPWPPYTLYFKCTVTWTWNYTHTHTHRLKPIFLTFFGQ